MLIIEHAIERSKAEILKDIADGIVPDTVCRFYQLHDYVDANVYGGFCDEPSQTPQGGNYWWPDGLRIDEANAVQDAVDAWLQERNPEQAKYEAEQDAIHPYRSYYMYRGKPIH